MMNTWLMWGLFPVSLVFSGFATAEGLKDTEKAIQRVEKSVHSQSQQMVQDKNEVKALILFGQLNQVFDSMCGAYRGNRQDEARAWENQFTNLLADYQRVSGLPYPMRRCG